MRKISNNLTQGTEKKNKKLNTKLEKEKNNEDQRRDE